MTALLAAADRVRSTVAAAASGPTTQKGSIRPELVGAVGSGLPGWGQLHPAETEHVPALMWPTAIETYTRMANDAQVHALKSVVGLPVQRYVVEFDPCDMPEEDAVLLADDLDLPIQGVERVSAGRSPERFNHRRHFGRSLTALDVGHGVFEHVGAIIDGRWRLVDLAPRPARTITGWFTDAQGRLDRVEQYGSSGQIRLEADRLTVYTWQGEVGDPRGRSALRPLYPSWVMKDRLMRIDVMKHQRNAMGIPVGWLSEDSSSGDRAIFERLLAGLAAGEDTNLILPHGTDMKLRGVEGQTSDVLASMRFHNEEMARAMLAMVIQAGQTGNGTLTSAQTHDDYLRMFHDAVVGWHCDTLTEQVVARWVARNRGPDAAVGRVVWRREEDQSSQSVGGVAEGRTAASARRGRALAPARPRRGAATALSLPSRDLRREPYGHELAAEIDFEQLEVQWTTAQEEVSAALLAARGELSVAAVEAINGMDAVDSVLLAEQLAPLLAGHAADLDLGAIVEALTAAAAAGVEQVIGEAERQGAIVEVPDVDYSERATAEATAAVGRLARQVADSVGSAAQVGSPPDATGSAVADVVEAHLDSLTSAAVDQAAAGATSRAQLAGRTHALEETPYREIYASALLDANTCSECIAWDGHVFDSLDEAVDQFPGGGNKDCEGGSRCRCTLVGVMETEQERAA